MEDGDTFRPDNVGADGSPLTGEQTVTVRSGGYFSVGYQRVKSSIGLAMSALPKPGTAATFTGQVSESVPLVNRWEIAQHAYGAEDGKPLPWYRPELLSERQRKAIERHDLEEWPLPPKLADAVREAAAETAGEFTHVSFREARVWLHQPAAEDVTASPAGTPAEEGRSAGAGADTTEEVPEVPAPAPESGRSPGRRPLSAAAISRTRNLDWWKIGRFALWLCAALTFLPFVHTLIVLMKQLNDLGERRLFGFMVGAQGTAGVPGVQHFASSVFWLGATISLFAIVAGLLRVFQARSGSPK